jgi:hypothetical protein
MDVAPLPGKHNTKLATSSGELHEIAIFHNTTHTEQWRTEALIIIAEFSVRLRGRDSTTQTQLARVPKCGSQGRTPFLPAKLALPRTATQASWIHEGCHLKRNWLPLDLGSTAFGSLQHPILTSLTAPVQFQTATLFPLLMPVVLINEGSDCCIYTAGGVMLQFDTKCMHGHAHYFRFLNCHRTPDACVHANSALSSKDSVQNETHEDARYFHSPRGDYWCELPKPNITLLVA